MLLIYYLSGCLFSVEGRLVFNVGSFFVSVFRDGYLYVMFYMRESKVVKIIYNVYVSIL